jgi:hypothetical protein
MGLAKSGSPEVRKSCAICMHRYTNDVFVTAKRLCGTITTHESCPGPSLSAALKQNTCINKIRRTRGTSGLPDFPSYTHSTHSPPAAFHPDIARRRQRCPIGMCSPLILADETHAKRPLRFAALFTLRFEGNAKPV